MIPPPKLDDRTFHDIVEEAISMIPRYAPEWTNHNPSDPGITLIELAAWMTDLLIYRLNQVPDKNYVAFLNLLGIKLRAPRAARALVRFALVEGTPRQRVPSGTQISTPQATEEHTVTFETSKDVIVSAAKIDRCFSYFDNAYSENSRYVDPAPNSVSDAFEIFSGAQRIERYLYLSDPRFANTGDAALLRIFIGTPERGGRDLARLLEWEYWEGSRWKDLDPSSIEVDRGEIAFLGPLRFEATTVNHIEGLWIRGRLAEVPESPEDTEIDTIRAPRRGRRRGPRAHAGVREPRLQRVPAARPRQEPLPVRQGSRRSTASSTSPATSSCRPPTRTSRSRCCSPTPA